MTRGPHGFARATFRSLCLLPALLGSGCEAAPPAEVEGLWGEDRTLQETLRIGSVSGGADAFGLINGLGVQDDGRIVVVDLDHREMKIFGPDGAHLRSVGREGDGPGEFRFPMDVAIHPNGYIWVVDVWAGRYSVFDADGGFREQHALVMPPDGTQPMRGLIAADGSFSHFATTRGADRRTALFRVGPDLTVTDSVVVPDGPDDGERCLDVPVAVAQGRCIRTPLTVRAIWTVDREGNLWSAERTDTYRLVKQSPAGDTLAIVTRDVAPTPVSEAEFDRLRTTFYAEYPDLEGRFELTRGHLPAHQPIFDLLWASSSGEIWVRRPALTALSAARPSGGEADAPGSALGGSRFDVFLRDGQYLGEATSPIALEEPYAISGNRIVAVTRDALDVSYVVRLQMDP